MKTQKTNRKILNSESAKRSFLNLVFLLATTSMIMGQSHNAPSNSFKKSASDNNAWASLTLLASCPSKVTYTDVKFRTDMTTGLDITYDAGTCFSDPQMSIYTLLVAGGEEKFAIQCLPNEYGLVPMEIPVGVNCQQGGEIVFTSQLNNLAAYASIILEDRELNIFTDLLAESSEYRFTAPAGLSGTGRFFLHAINAETINNAVSSELDNYKEFNVFAANNEIHINGLIEGNGQASVYDLKGRQINIFSLNQSDSNILPAYDLTTGIFIVSVKDGNKIYSQKIFLN